MINEVLTKFHYDELDDKLTIERVQDVEPYIERNKRLANDAQRGWKGEFHHVASIPLVIIEKVKKETGMDLFKDREAMRRFLNDPGNKYFRTKLGTV